MIVGAGPLYPRFCRMAAFFVVVVGTFLAPTFSASAAIAASTQSHGSTRNLAACDLATAYTAPDSVSKTASPSDDVSAGQHPPWLGLVQPSSAVIESATAPIVGYTYHGSLYDRPANRAVSERGPPVELLRVEFLSFVDRGSHSTRSRAEAATTHAYTTHQHHSLLAQVDAPAADDYWRWGRGGRGRFFVL